MIKDNNPIWANQKNWHPLTEIPAREEGDCAENGPAAGTSAASNISGQQQVGHPYLQGVSAALIKIAWDIMVFPYSSVSVRIKRLGISGREYIKAKLEGCEKGYVLESTAGQTIYLIPYPKTFDAFNMTCPYDNKDHIEHSYYVGWGCFLLGKDPQNKSVRPAVKLGSSSAISDIVTAGHDGKRSAWEVTLSTTNILTNACKYENTDFARIVFLCRNYRLREAVRACCREGGLNPDLMAKLEFMHFSQLLRRQRKLSSY